MHSLTFVTARRIVSSPHSQQHCTASNTAQPIAGSNSQPPPYYSSYPALGKKNASALKVLPFRVIWFHQWEPFSAFFSFHL